MQTGHKARADGLMPLPDAQREGMEALLSDHVEPKLPVAEQLGELGLADQET